MIENCAWNTNVLGRIVCVEGVKGYDSDTKLCDYAFDPTKCPKFTTYEQITQRDADAEKTESLAREAAVKQAITARIQAMLAAARKEIEELRRMLAEFGEKNDTAGVAICLRTLAEINMSATDHAMTFARERLVDELLATKEKAGV
jgi:hypothetical protein